LELRRQVLKMLNIKTGLERINFKPQMRGLTRREFILVIVMLLIIEGYLLHTYLLKPAYDSYIVTLNELKDQKSILNSLKADYERKDEMKQEIKDLDGQLEKLRETLPAFLSQEEAVLSVEELSANSRLMIKVVDFSNATDLPLKTTTAPATGTQQTAEIQQTENAGPAPVFVEQLVSTNFTGDYSQLHSFLENVEKNSRKIAVRGLSVNTNNDNKLVGSINLSYPSMWDDSEGQKPYIMDPAPSFEGRDNPFKEYENYSTMTTAAPSSSAGSQEAVTPDFYVRVNSYLNNSAKVFISNPYNKGSEARYDGNDTANATMVINGSDGKYSFKYSLGTFNIVQDNLTDIKNGRIRIEVLVQSRRSDDDKVGLILNLTNNTDVPVEIAVKGDDPNNPRFILGNTSGNVVLK